ncbi:nSTAND1 domain-containing NTPase [Pareuzebyella sediminis]|uniref:nSTAND1 domain-containing NTPase n=1 Tax=Pareuzebyella sediminis TaxID=2607998 RepID=UPI0011EE25A8|nr:ATP-binding protein [Pareuzebyella sediminis]
MPNKTNPYVGLRPYHTDENSFFFGRETQTLELLQRLYHHKFVAVIGSSGCGKSSLLRAGLIPALKGGFLVEDSNRWIIAIMKPGESPLYNLAEALLKEIDKKPKKNDVQQFVTQIEEEGIDAILERIRPLREKDNFNFFLLVDQFEELFAFAKKKPEDGEKTRADSMNESITLVNILLELSQQNLIPFYIVFTMRSDFIGDCAEYHGLPEAMNKSQYLVPRLSRQELKKVIEGPARLSGKKFNSALTSKLTNNLGDVQDELPILQHILMRMWEYDEHQDEANKDVIGFEDYEAVGGIEKALSRHAQEALENLSSNEKKIAKTLFKALTKIDENNRKIRRQVRLSKLVVLTEASEEKVLDVINSFNAGGRSFLVIESIGDSDDKLIDISHESLIRQWRTLRELVVEEARNAKQYKALSVKERQYKAGERALLTGIEYERTEEWWNNFTPNKAWASQYDTNYENCTEFIKESKRQYTINKKRKKFRTKVLPRIIIAAVVAAVIAAGLFYVKSQQKELQDELERKLTSLKEKAKQENTMAAYSDYLGVLTDKDKDLKKEIDSILNKKNDSLWERAKRFNTVEEYNNYLETVTASVDEEQTPPKIIYFDVAKDNATNAQKIIENLEKQLIGNNVGPPKDNEWDIAQKGNTVNDYINYMESNTAHYDAALKKLNSIGSKGWLFVGRTLGENKDNLVLDKVFDIIARKDSTDKMEPNAMLKKGDIVQLRGKAHRKIRKTTSSNSQDVGLVRDNTKYYVNEVEIMGSDDNQERAVFVEIIF